jgi:hypothetical protein
MKEQIISFQTAIFANEKDFNIETRELDYMLEGNLSGKRGASIGCSKYIKSSTQSLLQKWLREVHGVNIFMTFKPNIKKWDFIPYFMSMNGKEYIKYNSEYTKIHNERRFDTYEEALELGLQEALKLIQK